MNVAFVIWVQPIFLDHMFNDVLNFLESFRPFLPILTDITVEQLVAVDFEAVNNLRRKGYIMFWGVKCKTIAP